MNISDLAKTAEPTCRLSLYRKPNATLKAKGARLTQTSHKVNVGAESMDQRIRLGLSARVVVGMGKRRSGVAFSVKPTLGHSFVNGVEEQTSRLRLVVTATADMSLLNDDTINIVRNKAF